jgi:Domain of unknown function (DUF1772)
MLMIVQVVTVTLVAMAMAMSLAHALEMPGKLRLEKHVYYAMQPIYYPGFTVGGGIGEFGGTIATALLLFLTPSWDLAAFWLTLVALLGLVAMQAVYWTWTHPVNRFWVEGQRLDRVNARFFAIGGARSGREGRRRPEWTELRDRWEYSHVARAGLALSSFVLLVIAVAR